MKEKSRLAAFNYLMSKKETHSKLDNLQNSELKLQPYLSSDGLFKEDAQLLFKLRTRMANFKLNFKNGSNDLNCLYCFNEDDQSHILICHVIGNI